MKKFESDVKEILFSLLGSNFSEFDTKKITPLFINCFKTFNNYMSLEKQAQQGKATEIDLSAAKSDLLDKISKLSLGIETVIRQTQATKKLNEVSQSVTYILVNLFLDLISKFD
jgi:trehalose-6-phosphate synthase